MAQPAPGWHRDRIKAALQGKLGPITHLSVAWGYPRSSITTCLISPDYSRPLEMRIAEALGVPLHELWPNRWRADGSPLPRPRETNRATPEEITARQKAEAA
jgi:Ner family transcriptional regulator